jgi:uncharacterized RDD family membrane protein YckC
MALEDRHVTATPEGVSLNIVLAGLGSRCAAYAIDFLIQLVLYLVFALVLGYLIGGGGETSRLLADGALALFFFLDFFGYFVLFEMLWSGRSIGKRANGLRVVRIDGSAPGFWSSTLRNVLRLIDMIPFPVYLVGSVLVLSTTRNQRLGDLAGGTLVIRNRTAASTAMAGRAWNDAAQWTGVSSGIGWVPASPYGPGVLPPELAHWDVSAITVADVTLVSMFLTNRGGYTPEARQRLGLDLARGLWPRVAGAHQNLGPEQFLEAVVLVKSIRG